MVMIDKNYYAVLQVQPSADVRTVEDAYWSLAWTVQADAREDPSAGKRLEALNEAYSVLGTPVLRAEYDQARVSPPTEPQTREEPRASTPRLPLLVARVTLGLVNMLRRLRFIPASARSNAPTSTKGLRVAQVSGESLRVTQRRRPTIRSADVRASTAVTDLTSLPLGSLRAYSEAEVKRLLVACDIGSPQGVRNRALVLVLFDTGLRRGELLSMNLPDWERRQVALSGKTGVRHVPLGVTALQALKRYVRRWDISEPPLWRGKRGPLTGSGVLQVVRRLSRRAGVPHKGVHAFRRAAATQMKCLGMNDSDILEVLGWRDITMLRRYTSQVAEELARAAHSRHSPADALNMR